MKKLLAITLVALSFAACKKHDSDRHCWTCYHTKTSTNSTLTQSTWTDSLYMCDMTPDEIHVYEDRYQARELDGIKYSDMHCLEQPDKE